MKIKIKVTGHQYYAEHEGDVIAWAQTVEAFYQGDIDDTQFFQVPAVIINTGSSIQTISLKKEHYQTKIEVLKEEKTSPNVAETEVARLQHKSMWGMGI